uniref:Uncharacterized protein n=1 Tax=Coccidioides posadasii RMSCC 3488 TaxID=454284 RepID=A0A0J6F5F5_COCPO|nr:hypothetical protein CPAG_00887 [Coccidioides posadasii RMSCC 3488]
MSVSSSHAAGTASFYRLLNRKTGLSHHHFASRRHRVTPSSLNSQGLNRGVVDPCQQSGRDSKSIVIKYHITWRPVESILVGAEQISVSRDSGFYVTEAVRRYPWGDLIFGTKVEIGPLNQPRLRGASFRSRLCPAYNASTNTSIEISNQSGEPSNHMESHWITILFLPLLGG